MYTPKINNQQRKKLDLIILGQANIGHSAAGLVEICLGALLRVGIKEGGIVV